ncbi:MAG: rod shape-determining protein RodA [Treponema sp.]|jgi:rod shape determining protein RodA|nr:rod shape-determining protein RodA [Treponema sp.]
MKFRDIFSMDFLLLLVICALTVTGIFFIYSSGVSSTGEQTSDEYIKQIVWGSVGLGSIVVLTLFDYKRLYNISLYLYAATLLLLLYTFLFGKLVNGARAWIGVGSFGVQPSEFAKITTIVLLARYLDATKRKSSSFKRFFIACVIVFIPMGIILIQPDFGTSLVFIPILLIMTFIAGVRIRYIIFLTAWIGLTGILMALPLWQTHIMKTSFSPIMLLLDIRFIAIMCAALAVIGIVALIGYLLYRKPYFFWIVYSITMVIFSLGASFAAHKVLKDYQIMRLIVFLDPQIDPQGAGWNIIQSTTAIGSGGFMGRGFLQGTQSHYRFLPQQSTDFIFSILSEESGFVGGIIVFALFLVINLRLIRIMRLASNAFGVYITAGLSSVFAFHFLVNVGMAMGVMPITGIPLIFMSYGGSALLAAMVGIGLVESIYVRRLDFETLGA